MADDASKADERKLADASRRGDRAAQTELVRRYERRAYALALRLLGSPEDARDAVQEAFLRAFRHLRSLRGDFGPWFLKILINFCYDARRKRRRVVLVSLNGDEQAEPPPDTTALDTVRMALARMPERYRTVLVLRDLEGFSTVEAAETLGLAEGAVRVLLLRARRRLAQILEQMERSEHR